jgi:FkbM family methyltransferase
VYHFVVPREFSRRVWIVGELLRFVEKYLFAPKLKKSLKLALQESRLKPSSSYLEEIVCFDVGANRGQTVRIFRKTFPRYKIYAFEPDRDIFSILKTNFREDKKVNCFNVALAAESGKFPFWVSPLDETSSMRLPDLDSSWNKKKATVLGLNPKGMYRKTYVDVMTLDDFVSKHRIEKIDVLKIDVEGGEFQVLIGAELTFQSDKISIVQYENHSDDLRPSEQLQIEEFLKKYGFSAYSSINHAFGNFSDEIYLKRR